MVNPLSIAFWIFGLIVSAFIFTSFFYRHLKASGRRAENVTVVIVTVGDERVMPALRETVDRVKSLGVDYVIVSSNEIGMANTVVVPRERDGNKNG